MLELTRHRLILRFKRRVWEVQEINKGSIALGTIAIIPVPASWVLIRRGITISIPKIAGESFAEFKKRLIV